MRIVAAIMLLSLCACGRRPGPIEADPEPSRPDASPPTARDAAAAEDTSLARYLIVPITAPASSGTIAVHGEDLQAFGDAVHDELGRCFADARARDPSIGGVITVRFSLRVDGGVEAPAAGGKGIDDRTLLECVVAVVRRVRFEPPPNALDARSYAFTFTAGND